MKAEINRQGCIACGTCEAVCPAVFRMADDGLAEVCGNIDETSLAKAEEARDSCPVSVISLVEITAK